MRLPNRPRLRFAAASASHLKPGFGDQHFAVVVAGGACRGADRSLDMAGGTPGGKALKFWTPGGSSTPLLTDKHLDVPLDFESVSVQPTPDNPDAPGSMLGTRALQIFDETTCVVRATLRWTDFYAHESCGKCTPCREGTYWLKQILHRLEHGEGTEADIEKLLDICDNIFGRSFCAR